LVTPTTEQAEFWDAPDIYDPVARMPPSLSSLRRKLADKAKRDESLAYALR